MKRYKIKFIDAGRLERIMDVFAPDKVSAQKQIEENFIGCYGIEFLSEKLVTEIELEEINNTGAPHPRKFQEISVSQAVSNLMEFAPNILGVCPECGQAILFDGWKCFECGFDPKDMTGDQKLHALNGLSWLMEKLNECTLTHICDK